MLEQHFTADVGHFPATGPVASKGLWTSLTDWIGANSFDHANKETRWKPFFSNTGSVIAQELEGEIGRVSRLWLDALQPLGRDPAKENESPFFNCFGDGKLSFGAGIQKLQKACFDDIKRLRFRRITQRAQALPYDDPRRMAFFGRYGDKSVRQLLLGCAHPLVPLLSEEFQVAVQRSFGLPLKVLEGHVGEKDSQSRQQRAVFGGQVRPQASDGGRSQGRRHTHLT